MKIVWGLYIYSVLNGVGFETSHSITSLDTYFISKKECINSARLMNSGSAKDREIGLDPGIKIRYICLAKPKIGLNTWYKIISLVIFIIDFNLNCPSGGMVDAADSKSAAFTGVRVRVSPRAPKAYCIWFNYFYKCKIYIYFINKFYILELLTLYN